MERALALAPVGALGPALQRVPQAVSLAGGSFSSRAHGVL